MNNNTLAIALAWLLIGGVATAAYINNSCPTMVDAHAFETETDLAQASSAMSVDGRPVDEATIVAVARLEYANVVEVKPVTKSEQLSATVIGTDPVRETATGSAPREVCIAVAVQDRLPERDGSVGGTVAGAVIGGLLGNQLGKAATVAGAAGRRTHRDPGGVRRRRRARLIRRACPEQALRGQSLGWPRFGAELERSGPAFLRLGRNRVLQAGNRRFAGLDWAVRRYRLGRMPPYNDALPKSVPKPWPCTLTISTMSAPC